MSHRQRVNLAVLAALLALAAAALLLYALLPAPVESLRAAIDPSGMIPPLGAP